MRKLIQLVPFVCISVLLVNAFRLFKGAYLGRDDFNNLYWVQRESLVEMAGHILNPLSSYFRPTGTMCYWLLLRFFDLNPGAYHGFLWVLHSANTFLVYILLGRLTRSLPSAAVGAMLFASQAVFAEIYWDFGTVFEVVAGFFSLLGILAWTSERRGWREVLLASLALLFAAKGKEMALTMPAIWAIYDLLLRKNMQRGMALHWLLPGAFAACYAVKTILDMRSPIATHPYYMSINWPTLATSFGIYCNMLLKTNVPWQLWCLGFLILSLIFALLRSWLSLFFVCYVLIAFLPVIFLVNHRHAFYWYIPFVGISGLAAVLTKNVYSAAIVRNPHWLSQAGAITIFILLCLGTFELQKEFTRSQRTQMRTSTNEYRAFVVGLKNLPTPLQDETIFFDSMPSQFDKDVLLSATQVALGRTDVGAKLVTEFPPEARYRLRFKESRLIRLSQ